MLKPSDGNYSGPHNYVPGPLGRPSHRHTNPKFRYPKHWLDNLNQCL